MRKVISAKNDVVFKIIFTRNKELLTAFLKDVAGLEIESPEDIEILNPEIPPELYDGKLVRLDINAKTKTGQNINIEMQVVGQEDFIARVLYYWAKMYTNDLKKGEDYSKLRKSISISILDFDLFECKEFFSEFGIIEKNRFEMLTDKLDMYFFELKKVKAINEQLDNENRKQLWLQFISADSEEELNMLNTTDYDMIQKGVNKIFEISEDDRIRELVRQREKSEMDYYAGLSSALNKGIAQGRAEGEIRKAVAVVKKLMEQQFTLENALAVAEIDKETYEKYSD